MCVDIILPPGWADVAAQGILTEGEGTVLLISSLRLFSKEKYIF